MSTTFASPARRSGTVLPAVAIALGLIGLGVVFLPEWRAAVRVWIDSTAYGHCFLVAPMAAYLVWDRRDRLRGLVPASNQAFAVLCLPFGLAWFTAERLGLMEGRQLVALGFVELLFLVVLGWRLYRALSGPLLFLVFLVPFGAFLTPVLQSFTAKFTEIGLIVLGIPHYVNEMVIETSAGTFLVAEACAGLRFLIAAVAFGVFYALLNYRSPGRRLTFIAISILVPIIANGFRALGIVVLGQILGSAQAAAADHIVYGWVFFSAVMLMLVVFGMALREAPAHAVAGRDADLAAGAFTPWPAVIILALAALGPVCAAALEFNVARPSLAGTPQLIAPSGCQTNPGGVMTDRYQTSFMCGPRTWTVTVQALAARSTGSALSEALSRLNGPLGAEDATTTALRDVAASSGNWQLTVAREPESITAIGVWIHGKPAQGGLLQRLMLARDSVFGNDILPLIVSFTLRPSRAISEAELRAITAELTGILNAQPDLNAEAARLTRPASPS